MKQCLNLGCGLDYRESTTTEQWTNLDIDREVKADLYGDASNMLYLETRKGNLGVVGPNVFDHIYSHHSLEHLPDLIEIVDEMARVSKNRATWEIIVPYWSWVQNIGNPHHRIQFTEHTFDFFGEKYKRGHKKDYRLEVLDRSFTFADGIDPESGIVMMSKYINVVREIAFKIKVHK